MIKAARSMVRMLIDVLTIVFAAIKFQIAGRTPQWGYMPLIRLFCATSGRSNDLMASLASIVRPPRLIEAGTGVLPWMGEEIRTVACSKIDEDGYFVFTQKVSDDICERLTAYAMSKPAVLRVMDGETGSGNLEVYDSNCLKAVRYDFPEVELLKDFDIQQIIADPTILAFAQDYLRSEPILDAVRMWWNTPCRDVPDVEAAQLYHFDMDRIRWIKFFIHITDVTIENGPHTFVSGSHRAGGIPRNLLRQGYARLTDEDIAKYYPQAKIIEFVAPRGAVIAEDTRGLHKGTLVKKGARLMLQLQFSSSVFGANYPLSKFPKDLHPNLEARITAHPRVYSMYTASH